MQKRGQVYILVALVLAIVIFGLVQIVNRAEQESFESDFEELSDNYASESAKLINALIANPDVDISSAFINFTILFTSYSKTINPKFGLIYAFYHDGKLHIGNYLDTRINVQCEGCSRPKTIDGCFETIPATVTFGGLDLNVQVYENVISQCNLTLVRGMDFGAVPSYVDITIKDVPYRFGIKPGHPEIVIVSWESRAEQRKVFTEGEFVSESDGNAITLNDVCLPMGRDCDLSFCQFAGEQCVVRCQTYITEEDCVIDADVCHWVEENGECANA